MKILAVESSCDETAAAVIENGRKILSNVISSQIEIHAKYGGVIPEIAARSHIESIIPAVDHALREANTKLENIDAIATVKGPGLIGSLLIGSLTAQTIAKIKNLPLIGVNHVFAHPFANFLTTNPPKFPFLSLIVSGGHTQLMLFEKNLDYKILGSTQDDAAGEAFDKVAKLIGLSYPGGPAISKISSKGDKNAFKFPHAKLKNPLDFSFSGLKTAVLRQVLELTGEKNAGLKKSYNLKPKVATDIATSFEKNITDNLVQKTLLAKQKYKPKSIVVGGGVAANPQLRKKMAKAINEVHFVEPKLCTDNAAMIGALAYQMAKLDKFIDPNSLEIDSSLETL